MRKLRSDGLCRDDSLDARSFGLLNDFSDTLLVLVSSVTSYMTDEINSISSAIFAVLYKIFDRNSDNSDFVFCKIVGEFGRKRHLRKFLLKENSASIFNEAEFSFLNYCFAV